MLLWIVFHSNLSSTPCLTIRKTEATTILTQGDPGAGTGILSSILAYHLSTQAETNDIIFHGFETDERLHNDLVRAWEFFTKQADINLNYILDGDFTEQAKQILQANHLHQSSRPDFITCNPPYNKLKSNSELARVLKDYGVPVSNLYAAFTVLAVQWLNPQGHLLEILPRSFCSGVYFKPFRRFLMKNMSIEHITLYKSRSCFKNVLQENILIYGCKKQQSRRIRITVANDPTSPPEYDLVLPAESILSEDVWALPRNVQDIELFIKNQSRTFSLQSLGYQVSTGKTELHRLKGNVETTVVYAADFDKHGNWTWEERRKPRSVLTETKRLLDLPTTGGYVVLKRISSNDGESPVRLMPAWLSQESTGLSTVSLDNHVQYIHKNNHPLSLTEGLKLCDFLRSQEAQAVMRTINGTTQINCNDIAQLRFPDIS